MEYFEDVQKRLIFDELNPIEMGAEWCDVTIRCYLLRPCIAEVIEELDKEVLDKIFEQNKDE